MTVVDDNGETISHKKAIMKLVREDAVRNLFAASSRRSLQNGKDDFSSDKDNSLIASSEEGKPKRRVTMKAAPFVKTRLEEETSSLIMPSDVSSVMLSPLVEVPVQSFATSEFTKSTLGIVLS